MLGIVAAHPASKKKVMPPLSVPSSLDAAPGQPFCRQPERVTYGVPSSNPAKRQDRSSLVPIVAGVLIQLVSEVVNSPLPVLQGSAGSFPTNLTSQQLSRMSGP